MKFELTDEKRIFNDRTIYRIRAVKSFSDVNAGDLGGFVQYESNLSQRDNDNAWIYDEAVVIENAIVQDNAKIKNSVFIKGNAKISDNAIIKDAVGIYDNVIVMDNVVIEGAADIKNNAKIFRNAVVSGNVRILNNVRISDNAIIYDNVVIADNAIIFGNSRISNYASIYGNAEIQGNAQISECARIYENAMIRNGRVGGDAIIHGNFMSSDTRLIINDGEHTEWSQSNSSQVNDDVESLFNDNSDRFEAAVTSDEIPIIPENQPSQEQKIEEIIMPKINNALDNIELNTK